MDFEGWRALDGVGRAGPSPRAAACRSGRRVFLLDTLLNAFPTLYVIVWLNEAALGAGGGVVGAFAALEVSSWGAGWAIVFGALARAAPRSDLPSLPLLWCFLLRLACF